MKQFPYFLAISLAGFTGGLLAGVAKNGFTNIGETFVFGIVFAVVLSVGMVYEIALSEKTHRRAPAKRIRNVRNEPRQETEGSFSDRLERFSTNVEERESTEASYESKMPFWSASDTDHYERSPPKSVSLMRMLLQRIRAILSGRH